MRFFNGKPLELLAPAGNFDIFKSVVETKCDAIYFGGQQLNMRMIRKGYNFTNEELKEAVQLGKANDKLSYITLNNLLDTKDIEVAKEYLQQLEDIKPDAIIVQDFAILELIQQLGLKLPVHASVMMNVHNLPMIQRLKEKGVSRVVLSRETTLAQVAYYHSHTDVELEYFTHGDMCVAHGAQCYYSSMIFGMSSNRGKCLKPCRWNFNDAYPLAVKDLSLYPYLPEMIQAGITSFKLEGRMREKEFITNLINCYGDAFDRYIEDPLGFDRLKDNQNIIDQRKRDLSVAYAFGNPGAANINTRWEGTGKFYSTGKMFSTPTEELNIDQAQIDKVKEQFFTHSAEITTSTASKASKAVTPTKLSVRVNSVEQAELAIRLGVDRIYLAADVYLPQKAFTIDNIKKLSAIKGSAELYASTPRMMDQLHFEQYANALPKLKESIDGLLVTNLGAINAFKTLEIPMVGDYSLNVFNPLAAAFYKKEGLKSVTASLELFAADLSELLNGSEDMEIVVHGPMAAMYLEHDLYSAMGHEESSVLYLANEAGKFPVYKDIFGRNHVQGTHNLCLLPVMDSIKNANAAFVRIEGQCESLETLELLITLYQKAIGSNDNANDLYAALCKKTPESRYGFGALKF